MYHSPNIPTIDPRQLELPCIPSLQPCIEQCAASGKTKDRPFNSFRIPATDKAKQVVHEATSVLEKYEHLCRTRTRIRRKDDQENFEKQVQALVCDLIHRELTQPSAWIAVSLSDNKLGKVNRYRAEGITKQLTTVLKYMATPEMEIAELSLGYHNPFNPSLSKQSTVRAGAWLKTRIADLDLSTDDFKLDKSQEVIILKDTKEDYWEKGKYLPYVDTPQTNAYRSEVLRINDWLEQAVIEYIPFDDSDITVDTTDRRLYRYFNNGSFEQGGRLFGGFWQRLKKHQRKGIVIDGMDTVTLDYGQMIARILYGACGIEPSFSDAYAIPGLENHRAGVKKLFSAMLHSDKPLKRKPKESGELLPKDYSVSDLTNMIMAYHEPVSDVFYSGRGLYLTYKESTILLTALTRLIEQGITALPIHDALVIPEPYQDQVKTLMLQVFKEQTGIDGLVSVEG